MDYLIFISKIAFVCYSCEQGYNCSSLLRQILNKCFICRVNEQQANSFEPCYLHYYIYTNTDPTIIQSRNNQRYISNNVICISLLPINHYLLCVRFNLGKTQIKLLIETLNKHIILLVCGTETNHLT